MGFFSAKKKEVRDYIKATHDDSSFGNVALSLGLVTEEQIVEAINEQGDKKTPVGEVLLKLGHIDKSELDHILLKQKALRGTATSLEQTKLIKYERRALMSKLTMESDDFVQLSAKLVKEMS